MPTTPLTAPASRWTGFWLIILTLLSWASVPLFVHQFKHDGIDPFTANGWRYGISAAFWLPYLLYLHRRGQLPRALLAASAVPVAFNILGQTAFTWGPTLLDPGFFSFIFRIQIIFVTLGAYALFPAERALLKTWRYWLGVAVIAAGAVGLMLFRTAPPLPPNTPTPTTGGGEDHFALGVVISVLSGVFFSGYALAVRYYVSKYSPIASFGVICQFTAVGMIILMLILAPGRGSSALSLAPLPWVLLILSAFIGIAISHVMYYASLQRLGVSVSLGIIQLQPIATAVGSMLIFGERLNLWQWLCGLLGVGGAVLMLSADGALKKGQARLARAKADELQPEGS